MMTATLNPRMSIWITLTPTQRRASENGSRPFEPGFCPSCCWRLCLDAFGDFGFHREALGDLSKDHEPGVGGQARSRAHRNL
jgi:hypothetical protein